MYEQLEVLGAGSYANVYKAMELATNMIVAIKKFKHEHYENGNSPSFLREVDSLNRIGSHPSIIKRLVLYKAPEESKFQIVYQYIDNDLKKYIIGSPNPLSLQEIKDTMYQIVQGLNHSHKSFVVHRDLKPENILIDKQKKIKIADFGLARGHLRKNIQLTPEVQTLYYRAPQILLGETKYSFSVDCWSVGCIFAELLTKRPLFEVGNEWSMLVQIFQLCGTPKSFHWSNGNAMPYMSSKYPKYHKQNFQEYFKDYFSKYGQVLCPNGIDLLERLLTLDYPKRITMDKAADHPYFQDVTPYILAMYA